MYEILWYIFKELLMHPHPSRPADNAYTYVCSY